MVLYSSRFLAQKQFLKAHKLLMCGRLDMCSRGYSFTVKRMRSFIIHYSSETTKSHNCGKMTNRRAVNGQGCHDSVQNAASSIGPRSYCGRQRRQKNLSQEICPRIFCPNTPKSTIAFRLWLGFIVIESGL